MHFSSVVSLHTNPMTCGVAKFGSELARRLGVPFVGLADAWGAYPLFSLKLAELHGYNMGPLDALSTFTKRYGVFWHDDGLAHITNGADVVFYADPSLGSPGLWCPSLLTPSKPRTVRLFSFGMAHKLQTAHYAKVRQLLEAAGLDYRLRVSVGLHEGTSLDDATKHFDALREIMGHDKVTILGCLSDDAVSEELASADCVLAFFDKGLRANNTTVHAALDARCDVLTNWDSATPKELRYSTWDIAACADRWPGSRRTYTWDNLIVEMEKVCEASKSVAV